MGSWLNDFSGIETLISIKESLKSIANFIDLITHPIKIGILFWNWSVEWSYMLCLLLAIFAVLSYTLGHKKYAKLAPTALVIYIVLQAIGKVAVK